MSRKKLVIAGGGTGGHLFPGVAVVEALESIAPDAFSFAFVGAHRGIEARVVPKLGHDLRLLDVRPLKSGGVWGLVRGAASLPISGFQAARHVRSLKPDMVLAVGGYAAGPFTAVAASLGVPTAFMEQNAVPGLTNTWLGRLVKRGYLSFESTRDYFPGLECRVVGNPVRRAFVEEARHFEYAVSNDGVFRVLVVGGSGGARSLNHGVPAMLRELDASLQSRLEVVHQAGRGRRDEALPNYSEFEGKIEVVEFIDDMVKAYQKCDLLICRAGMSTIAEVTALGIPALYVPLPTSDGHQVANAREITEAGGGLFVDDAEIGTKRATRLVEGLIRNPESLTNLASRAKTLGHPDAAEVVARDIVEWLE